MKIENCNFPDHLKYSQDGLYWFKESEEGIKVGVTSAFVWPFGKVTSVRFKPVGCEVRKGMSIGWIEGPAHFDSVKAVFDCKIIDVNNKLTLKPSLINKSNYDLGWFAVVQSLSNNFRIYMIDEIKDELRDNIIERRIKCFSAFPDIEMYEIGVECSAALVRLNEILANEPSGTIVHIVSDDPTSEIEMKRWAMQTKNKIVDIRKEENIFHFIVEKE